MKEHFTFFVSPEKHFRRLRVVVIFLLLAVFAGEGYIYYQVRSHVLFQTDAPVPKKSETVLQDKLQGVLSTYTQKQEIRNGILSQKPLIAEPSN